MNAMKGYVVVHRRNIKIHLSQVYQNTPISLHPLSSPTLTIRIPVIILALSLKFNQKIHIPIHSSGRHLSPQAPAHLARRSTCISNISRSAVRVGNGTSKANSSVEEVSSALVAGSGGLDLGSGVLAESDGGGVGIAYVGELVAERVGNDVGVQGFALTATRELVCDLEGELISGTAVLASLEGYGGCALAEVCSTRGGITCCCVVCCVTGISCVVVRVVVGVISRVVVGIVSCVVVRVVVGIISRVVVGIVSCIVVRVISCVIVGVVALVCVTSVVGIAGVLVCVVTGICVTSSSSTASIGSVATRICISIGIGVVTSIGISIVASISIASSSTASRVLSNDEVTETSSLHEVEDTHALGSEGSTLRLLAESSSSTVNIDIRVDEGGDTTELRGNGQRSVTADVLCIAVGIGVGVLLSSNKANGSGNGVLTATELSDDLVSAGELLCGLVFVWSVSDSDPYLSTSIGSTEKVTNGGSSNRCCSTSLSTLNSRDGSNGDLLLAETGFDVGDHRRDEDSLGNHIGGWNMYNQKRSFEIRSV